MADYEAHYLINNVCLVCSVRKFRGFILGHVGIYKFELPLWLGELHFTPLETFRDELHLIPWRRVLHYH